MAFILGVLPAHSGGAGGPAGEASVGPSGGPAGQDARAALGLLQEGRAEEGIETLAALFAAAPGPGPDSGRDPGSGPGDVRRALLDIARRAPPRPDVVEAVVARADRLGPDGWLAAGILLRRAFRPLDALDAFDRARDRSPGSPGPDVEAGNLLAELRLFDAALERFARFPDQPAALLGRAGALAQSGETAEALAAVGEALAIRPGLAPALLLRAELLDAGGDSTGAVRILGPLAEREEPAGPASFRLGRILLGLREHREAARLLGRVVAAVPTNAEAWSALGRARLALGDEAGAEAAFRSALGGRDPDGPGDARGSGSSGVGGPNAARLPLASLLARRGETDEANRLLAEFERIKAESDESARLLAEHELGPDDFGRMEALSAHLVRVGDAGLALRTAQRFLVAAPDDPERHLLLAGVYRTLGGEADRRRVLERALGRFPDDGAARSRIEAALNDIRR